MTLKMPRNAFKILYEARIYVIVLQFFVFFNSITLLGNANDPNILFSPSSMYIFKYHIIFEIFQYNILKKYIF